MKRYSGLTPSSEGAMRRSNLIVVYRAAGHTGRFVVAELKRRGFSPVLAGRDPVKLERVGAAFPDLEKRVAQTSDPAAPRS